MAGKQRQVRTGAQTGFQPCRLPDRSERGQDQTHNRALADPTDKNKRPHDWSGLSGPEANVPNRVTDSHRETSSPRPVTHETHTVSSQKQLEGSRDNGKGHPNSKVTPPTSEMVAGGRQVNHYTH